jgi:hypothetical protein
MDENLFKGGINQTGFSKQVKTNPVFMKLLPKSAQAGFL